MQYLPADAATRRVLEPETAGWGITEQLLATSVDVLRGANWQRGGGKGAKPKPMPRPGVQAIPRVERHGHVNRPADEVAAYLNRFSPSRN